VARQNLSQMETKSDQIEVSTQEFLEVAKDEPRLNQVVSVAGFYSEIS